MNIAGSERGISHAAPHATRTHPHFDKVKHRDLNAQPERLAFIAITPPVFIAQNQYIRRQRLDFSFSYSRDDASTPALGSKLSPRRFQVANIKATANLIASIPLLVILTKIYLKLDHASPTMNDPPRRPKLCRYLLPTTAWIAGYYIIEVNRQADRRGHSFPQLRILILYTRQSKDHRFQQLQSLLLHVHNGGKSDDRRQIEPG